MAGATKPVAFDVVQSACDAARSAAATVSAGSGESIVGTFLSDSVGHALIAECVDQPIENDGRIVTLDRRDGFDGPVSIAVAGLPEGTRPSARFEGQL